MHIDEVTPIITDDGTFIVTAPFPVAANITGQLRSLIYYYLSAECHMMSLPACEVSVPPREDVFIEHTKGDKGPKGEARIRFSITCGAAGQFLMSLYPDLHTATLQRLRRMSAGDYV